jgi:SAM-dependent methyltransferase
MNYLTDPFDSLKPITSVSKKDSMVSPGNEQQYFTIGRQALRLLMLASDLCQKPHYPRILDYACGYGRVLRWIKAQYSYADITACDIDPDAVGFCASTFGVRGVVASSEPDATKLEGNYDLIWCGSLLTHLDLNEWQKTLAQLIKWTAECGVLIFSSQGRFLASELARGKAEYASNIDAQKLLRSYAQEGFAFEPYFESEDQKYGITVVSPSFLLRTIEKNGDLLLRSYIEQVWGVQDVVILYKSTRYFDILS